MSFPRYPKYRYSGVEWLGEIPEHWEIRRLKHACNILTSNVDKKSVDGDLPVRLCNYTDVYYNEQITGDLELMAATATQEQVRKFQLRANDVIITKDSESADDIAVAAFVPYDLPDVVCGYHLAIVRSLEGVDGTFIKRLFDSAYARACFAVLAKGLTRVGLGQYQLNNVVMPFPPVSEQRQIAHFLAGEVGNIDALIAEQRRLIELLQEKRRAVISHAVTKGLNPHAPMKDSGVEWLGEVPAHWEVTRIANLFREVSEPGNDELPVLSVSIHHGVSDNELPENELDRKVVRSEDRSKYKRVAPGDLVYNMMRAWQGGFGTVAVSGLVSPAYVVARPRRNIETAYVEHVLRTPQAVEHMRRESRGVADFRLRLYWERFKDIEIPLPPWEEMVGICRAIDETDARFRALADVCKCSIELLQERRIALISAAVTGEIDVRRSAERDAA